MKRGQKKILLIVLIIIISVLIVISIINIKKKSYNKNYSGSLSSLKVEILNLEGIPRQSDIEFMLGQVIVKFKSDLGVNDDSINEINDKYKVKKIEKLFKDSKEKDKVKEKRKTLSKENLDKINKLKEGFERTYILTFSDDADVKEIAKEYGQNPNVEYAELNYIYYIDAKPQKCTPNCTGKVCGDDGCGGSCGTCSSGYICQNGICVVQPPCNDTDGGQNYYVTGTCASGTTSKTDFCITSGKNTGYLTEYYCSGTSCVSIDYNCAFVGGTCVNGYCKVQCTDECSPSGNKTCSGNGYKTCGNYDSDSCLEWSSVTNCLSDEICENGNCVASGLYSRLVSWWKMDDVFGNQIIDSQELHNGTLMNDSHIGIDIVRGKVLKTDGINDYVNIGAFDETENLNEFTVSFWVKAAVADDNTTRYVFYKSSNMYMYRSSSEYYYFIVYNDTNSVLRGTLLAPKDTNWHHVVVVYNGTSVFTYIDMNKSSLTRFSGDTRETTSSFTISMSSSTNAFNGSIDDFMFFKRALSAGEVYNLYINQSVSCTNECSPSGSKVCEGNGYKTCGNYDADSCLEFSNLTNCLTGQTCQNGNCVTGPQKFPNDPYFYTNSSWGQDYDDQWNIKKISADKAWNLSQGEGIIVAVIDSGVDYNHPELKDNMWKNLGEIPNNNIDDDGNGYKDDYYGYDFASYCFFGCTTDSNPIDEHGHGTHCAGTIASVTNNLIGIAGIAPKAKIMTVKGLDSSGSGATSGLAQAVRYAVDNGADVLSNSWGGSGTSSTLTDAFNYAWANGVISIAAAGNSNTDVVGFMPANIDSVVAVAATTQEDKRTYFSNYGSKVEISAPGGAESGWKTINNAASSGGTYSRNSAWYPRVSFLYNSTSAPYNIIFYTNKGPSNTNLDYWVYNVSWSNSDGRWLIKNIVSSGTINCNSQQIQYHAPYTINILYSGNIMIGIRKHSKEGYIDIDSFVVNSIVYEENNPAVSLSDFEYQGILSLHASGTDMYKNSLSNPEYFNPTYPNGLMIVPEFNQTGLLYRAQGTSMACPHVSGATALVLSKYLGATNNFARNALKYSADNIDALNPGFEGQLGYGRLNAYKSLTIAVPSIDSPQNGEGINGTVSVIGSAYGSDFKEYQLYYYLKGNLATKTPIGSVKTAQVFNGILGTWNVNNISGLNILRLELKSQDGTIKIDEKEVLVNPVQILVLKNKLPVSGVDIKAYNSSNSLLMTSTTDLNGIALFALSSGIKVNFKITYDSITSDTGLLTTPVNYNFNLLPSNISATEAGLAKSGVTITVYKNSTNIGSKYLGSSGNSLIYLDNRTKVKFTASCSYCISQSSEELVTPVNYNFNFATTKVNVTSNNNPLSSTTVYVYNSSGSLLMYAYTDANGIARAYSKPGMILNFRVTYGTMTKYTGNVVSPANTSIRFPKESFVTLLTYNGTPIKYTYVYAYTPGNSSLQASAYTYSSGKALFVFDDNSLIYYTATYLNLKLNTSARNTPYDTNITFPKETSVIFLNFSSPLAYKIIYAYNSSGQHITSTLTSSNGIANICFAEPKVRFKASSGVYYLSLIVDTPNTIIIETSSYSQGYLYGKVKDTAGSPLSSAYVYLYTVPDKVLFSQVTTNSTGDYKINLLGIVNGNYNITVTRTSYKPNSKIQTLNQGTNYTSDFVLST